MAKRTESAPFSFATFCNHLTKINPESSVLKNNPFSKINAWIPLGNYLLNAQVTGSLFRGIPEGRVTMIAGQSGTGKTYLALNSAREAQKMGYYIIWIDTENAVDIDMMERFGINSELVDYQPVDDISMAINLLRNIAEQLNIQRKSGGEMPKIFVVLDSLGNLSTSKEKADTLSGSDKKDMTRPSEIKKLFRVMIRDFGVLKIPCVITNHTHKDIGSFITQDVIGGGGGAEYNPSVTLMLSKAQLKEDNVTKTGIVVTSK